MDSLIFLAILFLAGRWFLGRMKQTATTASNSDARRDEGQQMSFDTFGSFLRSGEQKEPTIYRKAPLQEGMSTYDYVSTPGSVGPRYGGSLGLSSQEGMSTYDYVSTQGNVGPRYGGSLGLSSLEGMDTCDPSLNHDRIISEESSDLPEEPKEAAGFSISFTRDAIMQGIVMSEILARPSERKWGRR